MNDGCTLGAKILPRRFYLFKNRDLTYKEFKDTLLYDDRVFAITGVNIASGLASGVSIGVNNIGLGVCSSTVLINDAEPYDLLLEQILREADSLDAAIEIVQTHFDSGKRYQWCNFVFASKKEVGVIEIGDGSFAVERDNTFVTRANHHLKLDTSDRILTATNEERRACGPINASQLRRQSAGRMIVDATALADFITIVSTHSPSKGFDSICRHKDAPSGGVPYLGETSYSYIIEGVELDSDSLEISFHVAKSNPCSNSFKTFSVDFQLDQKSKNIVIDSFP